MAFIAFVHFMCNISSHLYFVFFLSNRFISRPPQSRWRRLNEHQKLQTLHEFLVIGVYMVTVINILAATTTDTGDATTATGTP